MKTITIRLPDVEAAMLLEIQRHNKIYNILNAEIRQRVSEIYSKLL